MARASSSTPRNGPIISRIKSLTGRSWIDEYWGLVIAAPIVIAFTPGGGSQITSQGMDALSRAPEWYHWAVDAALGFAFARTAGPHVGRFLQGRNPAPQPKETTST